MARKNSPYFDDFNTMAAFSCRAAEYLQESLQNFKPKTLPEKRKAMHEIEHAEDEVKHGMMKRLAKEFVTPIDREDIIQMANELDDVTDTIDDVLIRVYMYNIKEIRSEALDIAEVIVNCCMALREAMKEFPHLHKSEKLQQCIIDVNTMEEKGDAIYVEAMRRLFTTSDDPVEIAAWSELFDRLEECCDACEDVADLMEIIVMKNS